MATHLGSRQLLVAITLLGAKLCVVQGELACFTPRFYKL
jgi:hypothetical protein